MNIFHNEHLIFFFYKIMKIIHSDVEIARGAVPVGLGWSGVMVLCAMYVWRHADLTE